MKLFAYYVGGDTEPQVTEAADIGEAAVKAHDVFGDAVHQVRPATQDEREHHEAILLRAYGVQS